jgi:hypothetical protein
LADKKKPDLTDLSKPDSEVVDASNQAESDASADIVEAELILPEGGPDVASDAASDAAELPPEDDEPKELDDGTPLEEKRPEVEETAETIQPEPDVQRIVEKRGGFIPALIGGVIAAGLGFLVARSDILEPLIPGLENGPDTSEVLASIEAGIQRNTDGLDQVRTDLSAIKVPEAAALAAMGEQITEVQRITSDNALALDDLKTQVSALDARLSELEKRPVFEGVSGADAPAYQQELAALQASIEEQRDAVETMLEQATAAQTQAQALEQNAKAVAEKSAERALVAQLQAELDQGRPFDGTVGSLAASGIDVPEPLAAIATEGVSTLSELTATFPEAARNALAASRSSDGESGSGLTAFIERQLGARSVTPREGTDPDAVLSRAEADLVAGRLSDALTELETLPEPGRKAMSEWTGLAQTRQSAVAAAAELASRVNTN